MPVEGSPHARLVWEVQRVGLLDGEDVAEVGGADMSRGGEEMRAGGSPHSEAWE